MRPQEFRDGLSNTAMFSEKTIGDENRDVYTPYRDFWITPVAFSLSDDAVRICRDHAVRNPDLHDSYAGTTWFYGGWSQTWYNHVLPPNSAIPDCSAGPGQTLGGGTGLYAARSFHPGGVHLCLADGAVRFINDTIDVEIWHALATRAEEEIQSGSSF